MSRNTLRMVLALCALALAVSVPAIALAHNGRQHSSDQASKTVGTIASFSDPTLVITSGGQSVSAAVTTWTRIRWAGRGHHHGWFKFAHAAHYGHPGDSADAPQAPSTTTDGTPSTTPATGTDGPASNTNVQVSGPPTKADLKAGALVRAANVVLTADGPVWGSIVLVPAVQTPPAQTP